VVVLFYEDNIFFSGISVDQNPAPVVGYPFVVEQFSILNVT
jgi:hypothetical protein